MSGDEAGCPPKDPEFKSISIENLAKLLGQLELEFPGEIIDSYWLRNYFKQNKTHVAKRFPELFSIEGPDIGVTYQWTLGLDERTGLLYFLKDKGVDPKLRVWLDVLFIDQLSTNVPMNLAKAQEVYALTRFHFVFAKGKAKLLSRGWCLFEICLRTNAKQESVLIGNWSDLGDKGSSYDYYGRMELTEDADRRAIGYALGMVHGGWTGLEEKVNAAITNQMQLKSQSDSRNLWWCFGLLGAILAALVAAALVW